MSCRIYLPHIQRLSSIVDSVIELSRIDKFGLEYQVKKSFTAKQILILVYFLHLSIFRELPHTVSL